MASGMAPRLRKFLVEFEAGLRRSSPFESCWNAPALPTLSVLPLPCQTPDAQTERPFGIEGTPQVSITTSGESLVPVR